MPRKTVAVADILGNQEVRELAGGVSRHTLIAWREKHGFPAPMLELACGELWDGRRVRAWLERRGR